MRYFIYITIAIAILGVIISVSGALYDTTTIPGEASIQTFPFYLFWD